MYLIAAGGRRAGTRRDDWCADLGAQASGRDVRLARQTIAIYEDLVYYTTPDGYIAALDARTGEQRWQTRTTGGMTSGAIVVEGR